MNALPTPRRHERRALQQRQNRPMPQVPSVRGQPDGNHRPAGQAPIQQRRAWPAIAPYQQRRAQHCRQRGRSRKARGRLQQREGSQHEQRTARRCDPPKLGAITAGLRPQSQQRTNPQLPGARGRTEERCRQVVVHEPGAPGERADDDRAYRVAHASAVHLPVCRARDGQQQQWPHNIELLFDREAP